MKGGSDYCLINTETEYPHLLPHIRSKYVGSMGDPLIDPGLGKPLCTQCPQKSGLIALCQL